MHYIVKIAITTALVIIISEISKRSTFFGALIASIPLVSILAIVWLYIDTKDISRVIDLSTNIFLLVVPSLALFISLPLLLKQEINFYLSTTLAIVITIGCYWLMINMLNYFGIKL